MSAHFKVPGIKAGIDGININLIGTCSHLFNNYFNIRKFFRNRLFNTSVVTPDTWSAAMDYSPVLFEFN
jgi:hypothetical protein